MGPALSISRRPRDYQDPLSRPTVGIKVRLIPSDVSKSASYAKRRTTMSATYRYRVSIALPSPATPASEAALRPTRSAGVSGLKGALAGTAGGAALGVGAAGFVPGIGLGVLIASGVLFGAFNGGLFGLLSRLEGK
jgi:hypothetical protein